MMVVVVVLLLLLDDAVAGVGGAAGDASLLSVSVFSLLTYGTKIVSS